MWRWTATDTGITFRRAKRTLVHAMLKDVVEVKGCSIVLKFTKGTKYDAIWERISLLLEPCGLTAWWLCPLRLQQTHDCTEHQRPQTPNGTVAATAADAVVAAAAADAVVVATPPFSIVADDEVGAATAAAFPVPFTLFVPKLCIASQEVAVTATAPKQTQSKFAQEYRLDAILGGGTYGVVRAAKHIGTGTEVAIKNYHGKISADKYFKETIAELSFYIHLGPHPNLVRPLDVAANNKGFGIVFERWDDSLHTFLLQKIERAIDADIMQEALRQMGAGLRYLHSKNVIHGDIKPKNILVHCRDRQNLPWVTPLSDNLKIALADLGGCIWVIKLGVNRFAAPAWQSFMEFHLSSFE